MISSLVNILDDDEYIVQEKLILVSEPGLYRLLSRDTSPQSKKFMRWIAHEVLPSIRSSGAYPISTEKMTCSVFIDTDGGAISLTKFSNFLSQIDSIYKYAVLKEGCPTSYIRPTSAELESAEKTAVRLASSLSNEELAKYASKSISNEQQLTFEDIRRRNPIELVFSGVSIALVVALIISGGKFELGFTKLRIELPPLGEGISKLRNALKSNGPEK